MQCIHLLATAFALVALKCSLFVELPAWIHTALRSAGCLCTLVYRSSFQEWFKYDWICCNSIPVVLCRLLPLFRALLNSYYVLVKYLAQRLLQLWLSITIPVSTTSTPYMSTNSTSIVSILNWTPFSSSSVNYVKKFTFLLNMYIVFWGNCYTIIPVITAKCVLYIIIIRGCFHCSGILKAWISPFSMNFRQFTKKW